MISVLVTHHKPELEPYLLAAIESLRRQEGGVPYRAHIVSSCMLSKQVTDYIIGCDGAVDAHEKYELDTPTKKVDYWLDYLLKDETYTMIMSNDVVLSSDAFIGFLSVNGACIQTAISNNEQGHRYFAEIPHGNPRYNLEDVDLEAVMSFKTKQNMLIRQPWIGFYCPFIHRGIWERVGRLDPKLDKKFNDFDFCLRAAKQQIPTVVNTACYALHFGSKTTESYMNKEEETDIDTYFDQKYTTQELMRFYQLA